MLKSKISAKEAAELLVTFFSSILWPALNVKAPQLAPYLYICLFIHLYISGEVARKILKISPASPSKLLDYHGRPIKNSEGFFGLFGLRLIIAALAVVITGAVYRATIFDSYPYLIPFFNPKGSVYELDFTLHIESQSRKKNIFDLTVDHTDIVDIAAYEALKRKYDRDPEGEESWPAIANLKGVFSNGPTHIYTDRQDTIAVRDPLRLSKKMNGVRKYVATFPTETGKYRQELFISRDSDTWVYGLAVWRNDGKAPIKIEGDYWSLSTQKRILISWKEIKRDNPINRTAVVVLPPATQY